MANETWADIANALAIIERTGASIGAAQATLIEACASRKVRSRRPGLYSYNGKEPIHPDTWRNGIIDDRNILLRFGDPTDIGHLQVEISVDDLQSYLGAPIAHPTPAHPQTGGRPSDKDRVIMEAQRRKEVQEFIPSTLAEFARQLNGWLDSQTDAIRAQKTGKVMSVETIEGHLRPLWSAWRR